MPDILFELPIAATPDQVYRAITEQAGLASWWASEVTAKPEIGSIAEFAFTGGPNGRFVALMEVTALEPNRSVRWTVIKGDPEWAGTHVTWDLTPTERGTTLRFGHHDYASTDGSFRLAAYAWGWYLSSLQDYLEVGRGRPGLLMRGAQARG